MCWSPGGTWDSTLVCSGSHMPHSLWQYMDEHLTPAQAVSSMAQRGGRGGGRAGFAACVRAVRLGACAPIAALSPSQRSWLQREIPSLFAVMMAEVDEFKTTALLPQVTGGRSADARRPRQAEDGARTARDAEAERPGEVGHNQPCVCTGHASVQRRWRRCARAGAILRPARHGMGHKHVPLCPFLQSALWLLETCCRAVR